ncbi:MAG: ATP-binding protein, partial [Acidimicrobiia bacterium]|nr:ATP-binding protein [Acidimicrobiia bacterium]
MATDQTLADVVGSIQLHEVDETTGRLVAALMAATADREIRLRMPEVIKVEGDPARLRHVVDNLLANVRTHTPQDAACEIALALRDGEAVLVVADHGPGVTDAELRRLGDRFYRVNEARTRASGGSGLGLSIARAIVE